MKVHIGLVAAAAIAGIGLGVAMAQPKAPTYVVGLIDVKDQAGYEKEFLPKARQGITDAGGKYLGGGFNKAEALTGPAAPNRVVLLQFESIEKVKEWNAKEGPFEREVGDKYATFRTIAIPGVEMK
jgi:uncharacterized protein (DUF1330 family)